MIKVKIRKPSPLTVTVRDRDVLLIKEREDYAGAYTVTPQTAEAVVLPTKDRVMKDDVTVFKVPRWDVANESGKTVYIGEENINGI